MGDAADDLRDREEDIEEDHMLGFCEPDLCPYCIERDRRIRALGKERDGNRHAQNEKDSES